MHIHPQSGTTGEIDARVTHPDGRELVRIDDCWFFADECVQGYVEYEPE